MCVFVHQQNAKSNIPHFKLKGKLDTTNCSISKPFTGAIIVEECDAVIKSMELQLVRVETCGCAEGFAKEGTENNHSRFVERYGRN